MNGNKLLLKKILWVLAVIFVILLTIRFIKVFPMIVKFLALAANVITIYLAYTVIKKKQ
ncbi:MAG: hypothetical protein MK078_04715 [Crocinitomicaceae bacterium]|nr:hypothetical protein [Crocinitomicaceae bacterium]